MLSAHVYFTAIPKFCAANGRCNPCSVQLSPSESRDKVVVNILRICRRHHYDRNSDYWAVVELGVFGGRFEGVDSPTSFLMFRIMPSSLRRSSCSA
jgi:hypothetical protein